MSGMAYWVATHLRTLSFTARCPPPASFHIRAEDVLNDPDTQLRRIAAWLGIGEDDSAMEAMRHPEASQFPRPGIAGNGIIGGFDPDFLRNPVPHFRYSSPCWSAHPLGRDTPLCGTRRWILPLSWGIDEPTAKPAG